MNNTQKLLERQAKEHKKLFEKFMIDEKYLHLHGTEFHMVFYLKGKRNTGFGLISPDSNVPLDSFDDALGKIALLYTNAGSINQNGGQRARINMDPFNRTWECLDKILHEITLSDEQKYNYEYCYQALSQTMELQKEQVKLYDEFIQLMRMKIHEGFQTEDIDYMLNVSGEMDYIQYKQLTSEFNSIDKYKYISEDIHQKKELAKFVSFEVKRYLKQFASDKQKLQAEIQKVTYVDQMEKLTKEEHLELVKQKILREQEQGNINLRKEIRFPKFI
ncbi:hypothetical protein [Oceanobacillus bengalensis]|uniref:Uncharacterized protein n=1 Tax=Oceanobacillus bengalensis TaxID=1435466 RepID=A0A494YTI5_9BACI|nr:hypothetical protein [Oceanobacillus bengalensis]RKQ13313.1 hypothetical protein D8M05_16690 [Oceanobacillus bengalensis]